MDDQFARVFDRIKMLRSEWDYNRKRGLPRTNHRTGRGDYYTNAEISSTTSEGYAVEVYSRNWISSGHRREVTLHCGVVLQYADGTVIYEGEFGTSDEEFWTIQDFIAEVTRKIEVRMEQEKQARSDRRNHLREGFLK